ncbi:hypothetical protein AQUCO_01300516v1 [Aquilegia coerulea]|uniref:Cytochrome P450 n=1 Tax=Aquilegia coerulea TaxID=218851 RepID=A0A2G5E234_AQUCA|nr:hypothetical protein AQUCO_01300516v1 [Aquilegia coerulea]
MDPLSFIFLAITPLLVGLITVFLLVTASAIVFLIIHVKELITQEKDQPPIAGSIFYQLIYFNTLFDYQTYLSRKYRNYRLITPTHSDIYTADPVNVEYILKTNFSNYTKGQYNYGIMKDLFGDGIFAVDGEKWRHQRKLASYEFSTKVLRDFSSAVFRKNAAKLVAKISEVASFNKPVDLQDLLMKSTLDSIFKVGFGIELNSLSGTDEFGNQFTKAFDDSNVIVYWRFVDPFWKLKRFLNIGAEASLKKNIQIIDDFVFQAIRSKREQMKSENGNKVKEDILSRFIIESANDPEHMTDRYLRDIILNFIIAGKDTSANTLTWFFYMLCKNPLIQEKVSQEVREATNVEDATSINRFAERLTEEALDKMQYLHAALSETLRLYPAVPVDGKSSEDDDVLPNGLKVKKGDGMNYMPYAMGRMTYIWGEDAEEFRPERWIENGMFRPESYFKFTAFQAGPRICLGKEFAYRQMKILASILLHFFKFKLVDQKKEATYRTMFTLHMDQGLHLFAVPRTN